jgi:hypothetical protein
VRRLNEAIRARGTEGDVEDWLFLALAHQRQGHRPEAPQWLAKAEAWIVAHRGPMAAANRAGRRWWTWLDVEILRREAEAVVLGRAPGRGAPRD